MFGRCRTKTTGWTCTGEGKGLVYGLSTTLMGVGPYCLYVMESQQRSRRLDTGSFVEWCEKQIENSRSSTARVIANDGDIVRFRIREETDRGPEDIVLIKTQDADLLRFERAEETRQFALHRRDVTLADKTLIVKTDGLEVCRAGTGTRNKRGPFPV